VVQGIQQMRRPEAPQGLFQVALLIERDAQTILILGAVGVQLDGLGQQPDGFVQPLGTGHLHPSQAVVVRAVAQVQLQRPPQALRSGVLLAQNVQGIAELGVQVGVLRFQGDGMLEVLGRACVLLQALQGHTEEGVELGVLLEGSLGLLIQRQGFLVTPLRGVGDGLFVSLHGGV